MIYLLRHGEAEQENGGDSGRRLTARGERQARAAGEALAALTIEVDACLASPKVRAADTARLACEALGLEPDLSDEVARLTGAKVELRKGGLAAIDGTTLVALMGPKELRAIARPGA